MDIRITPYPDEPYPDDEYQWKRWWIKKFFDPDQPLYLGDLQWVHACWKETKGRWHAPHSDELPVGSVIEVQSG